MGSGELLADDEIRTWMGWPLGVCLAETAEIHKGDRQKLAALRRQWRRVCRPQGTKQYRPTERTLRNGRPLNEERIIQIEMARSTIAGVFPGKKKKSGGMVKRDHFSPAS